MRWLSAGTLVVVLAVPGFSVVRVQRPWRHRGMMGRMPERMR
jgi:hypothetical protein